MVPAIFIPGLLCTGELFDKQRTGLDGQLSIDIGDTTEADTIAAMARNILDKAPERFLLLGFSMGGVVALEIMRQAGERVCGLVLVDTGARADVVWQTALGLVFLKSAEFAGLDWTMRRSVPPLLYKDHRSDAALTAEILGMGRALGLDVLRRQQSALAGRDDYRPSLAAIACPSLVISGEDDPLATPSLARELAVGIPGAGIEIIARSGHYSVLERPVEVNVALKRFVSERVAGADA